MNYQNKYLKYKTKYLNLKQIGARKPGQTDQTSSSNIETDDYPKRPELDYIEILDASDNIITRYQINGGTANNNENNSSTIKYSHFKVYDNTYDKGPQFFIKDREIEYDIKDGRSKFGIINNIVFK